MWFGCLSEEDARVEGEWRRWHRRAKARELPIACSRHPGSWVGVIRMVGSSLSSGGSADVRSSVCMCQQRPEWGLGRRRVVGNCAPDSRETQAYERAHNSKGTAAPAVTSKRGLDCRLGGVRVRNEREDVRYCIEDLSSLPEPDWDFGRQQVTKFVTVGSEYCALASLVEMYHGEASHNELCPEVRPQCHCHVRHIWQTIQARAAREHQTVLRKGLVFLFSHRGKRVGVDKITAPTIWYRISGTPPTSSRLSARHQEQHFIGNSRNDICIFSIFLQAYRKGVQSHGSAS